MDDFSKELEQLKNKIKELETTIKNKDSSSNMFGRSYSQVGSSDSDFIIKTRGLVKIQYGSKFIDLIKDGKINSNSNLINKVKTVDNIGVKDGFYVTDSGDVYLKCGSDPIAIASSEDVMYVSFLEELETTADNKKQALKNIGLLYDSLDDIGNLLNGFTYIISENKLYKIIDGVAKELHLDLETPYLKLIILQNSTQNEGALIIKGNGPLNSLKIGNLTVYSPDIVGTDLITNGVLNLLGESVNTSDLTSDSITSSVIKSHSSATVNKPGFILNYVTDELEDGTSESNGYLYVDKLLTKKEGIFYSAKYVDDSVLSRNDNSSNFASTAWVNKIAMPVGSIIMYNGLSTEIPEGWAICDGNNGTPNLIDKFIKAGTEAGLTGGGIVTLTEENLPSHKHTLSGTVETSSTGFTESSNLESGINIIIAGTNVQGDEVLTHSHTVDLSGITTDATGEGQPFTVEPTYYTLIFIMRVS